MGKEEAFQKELTEQAKDKGVVLSKEQAAKLSAHFNLLRDWNKVHNLTTISSTQEILSSHYLDCLIGAQKIPKEDKIWDLGSGAGFPGLILAVLWPETEVFLVETSRKKASFLQEAVRKMSLTNVTVENKRAESLKNIHFAVSRAAFSPKDFQFALEPILKGGKLVFWLSSKQDEREFCAKISGVEVHSLFSYKVSGQISRKLVIFSKN